MSRRVVNAGSGVDSVANEDSWRPQFKSPVQPWKLSGAVEWVQTLLKYPAGLESLIPVTFESNSVVNHGILPFIDEILDVLLYLTSF